MYISTLSETACITKRHLVKWMHKVTDKVEKHLHSHKFMRIADVMSDFLKRKKGRASGLLKLRIKNKLRE